MKIQCSCGAKFSFEITPEMAGQAMQFVCPHCGVDSSAAVTEMIRRELEASSPAPALVAAAVATPAPVAAPAPAPAPIRARLAVHAPMGAAPPNPPAAAPPPPPPPRIQLARATAPAPEPAEAPAANAPRLCIKHPGNELMHHCVVCKKAMCPKCMEMFGYVCSPFCRNKAEAQGIDVPVYANQRDVAERRRWRKVGLVSAGIAAVVLGLVGFWFWYAWIGQVPKPVFSIRFDEAAYSGQSELCGEQQIVFLHGETLARHDMKTKKEVWSRNLVDKKQIEAEVQEEMKATKKLIEKAYLEAWEDTPKMPDPEKLAKTLARLEARAMELQVFGSNIWVLSSDKLVRYDWQTGEPVKEIPLSFGGFGRMTREGDEMQMRTVNDAGEDIVVHLNLLTGESRIEKVGEAKRQVAMASPERTAAGTATVRTTAGTTGGASAGTAATSTRRGGTTSRTGTAPTAGLPAGMPGADRGKPLDPATVQAQAQRLPLPAKIALPAVLANNRNQERILNELDNRPASPEARRQKFQDYFSTIPSKYGFFQFGVHLLEEKIVTHVAMKAPPKKSALDGNVNASQLTEVANEILNEFQRDRGGDTVEEDQSRYQVTVRRMDGQATDWVGEVVGPPRLHLLKTVNVVAAGASLTVLDKMNKRMWQSPLTHPMPGGSHAMEEDEQDDVIHGQGPCVERGDRLYVFDEAVLTGFDLTNGTALWRVPSVGVQAMFFDDKGMLYINTTTADPESLKFSRQIDISSRVSAIVQKIDPKNGKILWTAQPGGFINEMHGKYIYILDTYMPFDYDEEEVNPYKVTTGLETQPYVRIRRINPKNGRQMWEHFEQRAPFDIKFKDNYIYLVFKKEVEVLKFFSF